MCGIVGEVRAGGAPVDATRLRSMARAMEHRGPDADGVWSAPGVGFAHRRLSIIDLSEAAAQPMRLGDAHALTYNGEIYNFASLREELVERGVSFRSHGDTEVLLHLLAREGADAVRRVHGLFAFAYWCEAQRSLLLARDRFGKKPLYYAPLGPGGREGLVFSSELKPLLMHPAVREGASIDPVAVAQLLAHEFIPAPRSIVANVRKLRAGCTLSWREETGAIEARYYQPPYGRHTQGSVSALVDGFRERVFEATRDRLVADVPVGVFLSGGLDSSLIAALAVRAHPTVKTFSVGFEDPSFDESEHARAVARHLGTAHEEETLSPAAMLDTVPGLLDTMDEPLADSSFVPTTLLAKMARRHVTVTLGGDGGDEILAGYPTFVADQFTDWVPPSPSVGAAARAVAARVRPGDGNFTLAFKLQQFAQGLDAPPGALRHARWLAAILPETLTAMAGPALTNATIAHTFDAVHEAAAGLGDPFDAATAFYLRVYLGEGVLAKVDRATMRASLEARAPLLDTRVVEYCLGLAPSLRVRGRTTKWLMRRALRGLVPESILDRPKKGFGAPVGAWIRGPLRTLVRDTLSPSNLRAQGFVDPTAVQTLLDEHFEGRRDHRKALWSLLVLTHWGARWRG